MAGRSVNATIEVAGLKLRGTTGDISPGSVTRTAVVNGDGTVDHSETLNASSIAIDLSYVADVELSAIEAIVEEPMLITFANGRKLRIPKATFQEFGAISAEGSVTATFFGPKTKGF